MNLVEMLCRHARERPRALALVDVRGRARREMTFADLDDATARGAAMLRAAGLRPGDANGPGDTVLLLQPVSIDLYVVLLSVFRARLAAIFVDPGAGRKGIVQATRVMPPSALIGTPRACLWRAVSPALRRIPRAYTTGRIAGIARRWIRHRGFTRIVDEPCADDTPALITFTSGSTGEPKVAIRSHGFLLAQHRALAPALGLGPDDIVATTFPVFVLSHLASGACSVLTDFGACVGSRPDDLAGVTAIDAAPAACRELAATCRREGVRLTSLRRVITGGGPVFPSLLGALHECVPDAVITTLYGSTEAEPIAHIDHRAVTDTDRSDMRNGRGLLVGPPVPGIALRVLRDGQRPASMTEDEFATACAGKGEPGEIVVSGAHVLAGYHRGVGDHETKFRVGQTVWHRTGDAGFVDEIGRVWLLGRVSARIRGGKGDLYPFQVEAPVAEEPGVRHSALVAREGKRVLLLELEPDAPPSTPQSVQARLAWAHLDRVVASAPIPMDSRHASKVDYRALNSRGD